MKLLTKAIEQKIPPLYSTEGMEPGDKKIAVKFFLCGSAWTWWAVEGEKKEDGDWLFFGLVESDYCQEWGYFTLSQLEKIRGWGGLKVERDKYPPKYIREVWKGASK